MAIIISRLKQYYIEHPLRFALLAGLFFRLLAAFFSKGYSMYDDHFFAIEPAFALLTGLDCDSFLPHPGKDIFIPHSFLYPELNAIVFYICRFFSLTNPQGMMLVLRIIHAFVSLATIYFGFRITKKIAGTDAARIAGILLALFWFMPMLSVRNLFEMACVPFVVSAMWFIVKKDAASTKDIILAALLMGLAFSFRYQTLVFSGGVGIALLIMKRWKEAIIFGLCYFAFAFAVDAISEWVVGEKPLKELVDYYHYNILHRNDYIKLPWFMYMVIVGGLLIPPISLFLLFGFVRTWKKHLVLFLPTLMFFVLHSSFPNKQERFILPIIPFIIILGIAGWREFYMQSGFWKKNEKLYRGFLTWFWAINIFMLVVMALTYTKRSNVESLSWLYNNGHGRPFVEENSNSGNYIIMPVFYHGKCETYLTYVQSDNVGHLQETIGRLSDELRPGYVLFFGKKNLEKRVENMKAVFPSMTQEAVIESGFVDKVLQFLNPINVNQDCYIYKINSYCR